jgi:hypothetical protein
MRFFPQTDAADAEEPKVTAISSTKGTTVVSPNFELGLFLLLFNK